MTKPKTRATYDPAKCVLKIDGLSLESRNAIGSSVSVDKPDPGDLPGFVSDLSKRLLAYEDAALLAHFAEDDSALREFHLGRLVGAAIARFAANGDTLADIDLLHSLAYNLARLRKGPVPPPEDTQT